MPEARQPLQVWLSDLTHRTPAQKEMSRNLFQFYLAPPPPSPPKPVTPQTPAALIPGDQAPALPPPIPIKFIGVVEHATKRVAIFSDGKGPPVWASEGQTVLGQYKLLVIGVETVTISYLDGSGMQTIPMRG